MVTNCSEGRFFIPTDVALEEAMKYEPQKVNIISSKTQKYVVEIIDFSEKKFLRCLQIVAEFLKNKASNIYETIEDKIGEESGVPDFGNPYPLESILAMAVAYPKNRPQTMRAIAEYYGISTRQALRVQGEISHNYPSFPHMRRLYEIYQEENTKLLEECNI